jgi:REP element-mobilizing transposase RayT
MLPGRAFYLPRLQPEFYQTDAVVLWTLPVEHRATGWLTASFHQLFRELMLHAAAREHTLCPVYCLMPDHIHLVWMGLNLNSDQRNGMAFLRTYLEPALSSVKFQAQAHDHVLKETERKRGAFAAICSYVRDNPVRANLVQNGSDWSYTGAIIPGYPKLDLFSTNYWERFWKIYYALRDPKCAERKLPPRTARPTPQ